MDKPQLTSQEQAQARLRETAQRGTLPHALVLSGSGERLAAARFAAAALLCTAPTNRPCGTCTDCRKVTGDIHPDVITVADGEHKIIPVDALRAMRQDVYIRPNEGQRKVYLFPDCAQLDERCQNILLKVVEEGPAYAAFLFCAENANTLLPTLRSRCVELKLRPAGELTGQEESPRVAELCGRIAQKTRAGITRYLVSLETAKCKREELGELLADCRQRFAAALFTLYGAPCPMEMQEIVSKITETLTKAQIMRTIEVLQLYCDECEWNVGSGHVLGALAVGLEGIF